MITAVIITARGGDFLTACIHNLRVQTHRVDHIIVVHSFSCPIQHKDVQYISTDGYKGYAHAVNRGLQEVQTPFFIVLNDDTIVHKTCIEELKHHLHPYRIVQPQIRQLDQPQRIENTGHWITKDGFNLARGRGSHKDTYFPTSVMVFSGAAFCAPRTLIKEIGLMDEDLFSFGEDLDWSLRAIRAGYTIRYVSSAIVHHKLGGTHDRAGFHKGRWVERNRICAIIRSWPKSLLLSAPYYTSIRLFHMLQSSLNKKGLAKDAPCTTALGALVGYSQASTRISNAIKKRKSDQKNWRCDDEEFLDMIERNLPPHHAL